ncbi:MAG: hypothetical protein JSR24_00135 [Proteobacteria bacterium]|nr:hypothetical protein [Pseudomonadota bacterium]
MKFPIGRLQQFSTSLDDVSRFAGLAATVTWALAGLAAYTAIILYVGWRVGVIEGAPLGGPLHNNVYRQIGVAPPPLSGFPSQSCASSNQEGWPL